MAISSPVSFGRAMTTGTIHAKVAGVSFKNPDGSSRQRYIRAYCAASVPLILRREPNNPRDKNTVSVWVSVRRFLVFSAEVQIGHLSADLAAEIAKHIDHGGTVTGQITEVTGGRRDTSDVDVNIVLTKGSSVRRKEARDDKESD